MYPAMKPTLVCFLLAALSSVGCKQSPSKLDDMPAGTAPKVVDHDSPASEGTRAEDLPKDADGRLARLERRIDKVTKILDEKLGPAEPDPSATYAVPIESVDPSEGPKNAKVTIVEGFEFLCPYCFMANPTIEKIIAKYPKDVRVVGKYLIIHGPPAKPPGMAACAAAKQGKYTQMKNALWNHFFKLEEGRPKMQPDQIAPENLDKIAAEAGLDVAKMKTDMDGPDCAAWFDKARQSLQPLGVNGTPAFFVNGRYVSGALPFEVFDQLIQEELAKADKAIADGVSQSDYYATNVLGKGLKRVKGRFED
ncbi:MAG: oxidoreductase [Myxococcales bacterium]|nr:oxidoreductase [Myxococcales bacterium]